MFAIGTRDDTTQLTSRQAQALIDAAETKASEMGVSVIVVILDASARLKAFSRMDGAVFASLDSAIENARTAALLESNGDTVRESFKREAPAEGLELTDGGRAHVGGGFPLKNPCGELIGAIGVSGGSVSQDLDIAQAAAAVLTV